MEVILQHLQEEIIQVMVVMEMKEVLVLQQEMQVVQVS
jgi:hypothetical protein